MPRKLMEEPPLMQEDNQLSAIGAVEQRIATLSEQIVRAEAAVQQWTDANASLSRSAAEARAKNQGMGRNFLGGLLGTKFRGAMRSAAAASNASIAKEVAEKRANIAEGKRSAQELLRHLKAQLAEAKHELKALTAKPHSQARIKTVKAKSASASLDLLQKLKQAHDSGLLTEAEYEEKRKRLVSEL
ncbi:MAG: SHOCT domain-containing protein [Limnobacter sp.]|jgi:uncharacterized small protein (DUF1192 family)|nr:MAG: SHOCT domain-containing protein [Limnobacter sp.]